MGLLRFASPVVRRGVIFVVNSKQNSDSSSPVFHVATPMDFESKDPEKEVIKLTVNVLLGIMKACVRGKTCHQRRQKTLGYRTQCSQCHPSVTGQFCGDCLYKRYGEHVLEALENPDWKCPGCRGICNYSLCRKHKGWLPTGTTYRKVSQLWYKSVAHYLIQTNKQSETSEDDETDDTPSQASAKRSLSFKEAKTSSEDDLSLQITNGLGL